MNSDCEMYSGLDGWEEQTVGLNPAAGLGAAAEKEGRGLTRIDADKAAKELLGLELDPRLSALIRGQWFCGAELA